MKIYPIGTVNKYGEMKMKDGTWKYVKKKDRRIRTNIRKKLLATICLLGISFLFFNVPISIGSETVLKHQVIDYKQQEFSPELFYKYLKIKGVIDPDFVMKQAIWETGWFRSRYSTDRTINNFGGFHYPNKRLTTAYGWLWGDPHKIKRNGIVEIIYCKVAKYKHWTDFVEDVVLYQEYIRNVKGVDLSDYSKAIMKAGYNPSELYVQKVRMMDLRRVLGDII